MRVRPWLVAALCSLAALAWQWVVADGYFHGNWSGFFFAGDAARQSPEVRAEHSFVFPHSYGYDGQLYHASAHDPLDLHGTDRFLDAPGLRYSRILLPAMSFILGAGRLFWIDRAYRALELAFLFLGVFCMGAYLERRGRSAWWGAAFLLIPGVHMSLERQLTDLPLCALLVAALLAFDTGRRKLCWLVLAAACLDRDTATVAVAAFIAASLWERRPREAGVWLTALLPQLLWMVYLRLAIRSPYAMPPWRAPFGSIVYALGRLQDYPFGARTAAALHLLDLVSIGGAVLAFALGLWVWLREKNMLTWLALFYALFGVVISGSAGMEYRDVYGFARVLSPLFLALLIEAVRRSDVRPAAPLALILPRAVLPIGSMTLTAIRNLL